MTTPRAVAALALLAALAAAAPARAQCTPGTILTNNGTPAAITFAQPGDAEFGAGYSVYPTTVTYNFWGLFLAGQSYTVCITATPNTLGVSSSGQYTKALADLEWKLSTAPDNAYQPISTGYTLVQSGTLSNLWILGAGSVSINVRVKLSYAKDEPGTYTTNIQLLAFH